MVILLLAGPEYSNLCPLSESLTEIMTGFVELGFFEVVFFLGGFVVHPLPDG